MSEPLTFDPYEALGISKDAELNDIKKAYRKLALTCHPDKTGTLPESLKKEKDEQFHKIQKAQDTLTNPLERRRYDEKVRLEELRAEVMRDARRDGPTTPHLSRAATFTARMPTRPSPTQTRPIFEERAPIYETRSPKASYDDEPISSRFEKSRSASKKHDDRFDTAGSRRSSGRSMDERKSDRRDETDDFYQEKSRQKEMKTEQRNVYNDRRKHRDKAKKQDIKSKRQVYVEMTSESESDDEIEAFMANKASSRGYFDTFTRKPRYGEKPSPRGQPTPGSESEDDPRLRDATNHIHTTGTRISMERGDKRNSAKSRNAPPPVPNPPKAETPKRSSARRVASSSKASSKEKKTPFVVDAEDMDNVDEHEILEVKPRRSSRVSIPQNLNLPKTSSARGNLPRATTFDEPRNERPSPILKRAQTAPHSAPLGNPPTRSSNLKYSKTQLREEDEEDSGYDSPPDTASPRVSTTKYRVELDSGSDSEAGNPRIVSVEPDYVHPRRSDRDKDRGRDSRDERRERVRREDSPRSPVATAFNDQRSPRSPAAGLNDQRSPRSPAAAAGLSEARSPRRSPVRSPQRTTASPSRPTISSHRSELRGPPIRSASYDVGGSGGNFGGIDEIVNGATGGGGGGGERSGNSGGEGRRSRHHHSSSNEGTRLFGEILPGGFSPAYAKNIVKDGEIMPGGFSPAYAKIITKDDVIFGSNVGYPRRGSADAAVPGKETGRDRDRDSGRERDRDSGRERDRDRDSGRDKDRDRDSGRDKDRDSGKDRDRDRDRDYRDSERRERTRDKDRTSTRDRGKDDYAYEKSKHRAGPGRSQSYAQDVRQDIRAA